jgi:NTE family protein
MIIYNCNIINIIVMNTENISEKNLQDELNDIFNININTLHTTKFNKNTKKTKLVLSGGGVKGICHMGALYALEQLDILKNITTYAASSIGAMLAFFLYIGYDVIELYKIIEILDFSKIKEVVFSNLLTQYGLDDGKRMELVFKKLCLAKKISPKITFMQMFNNSKKTLIITATCVNDKKVHYFSHETVPNMPILLAVRMSMSIPIYYTPVRYKNNIYIDGGCIDNFPIHLFKDNLDETIGIYITNICDIADDINNIEDYFYHTIQCLMEGHSVNSVKGYENVSIKIILKDFSSVDFSLDKTAKKKLFDKGYDTAMSYYI